MHIKINAIYSYIGDFVNFLTNNEQRIKNLLLDHEIQSKIDKLPDGREVKSLIFSKDNVTIRFFPFRIDVDLRFANSGLTDELIYKKAAEFFSLLGEIFCDVEADRLALVYNGFIDNSNCQAINRFAESFGIVENFGECNELTFKFNTPKTDYFEVVNSLLTFSMGKAKNRQTEAEEDIFLYNIDVNTLADNRQPRFSFKDFDKYFSDFYDEAISRIMVLSEKYFKED